MATAGRILIIPKGIYNEEVQYEMLDLVSYNGKGWICKKTSIGIAPEEGDYWSLMFDASEEIDAINANLEDVKNNPFYNRVSVTNIDATDMNFAVGSTSASTTGTFPDGFSKVGIVMTIRRTSSVWFQWYIDTDNKMATRVCGSGTWGEWDIKVSSSDLDTKATPSVGALSDGRTVLGCTDKSGNGFQIIIADSYIRFDAMTNGTATLIRKIDV